MCSINDTVILNYMWIGVEIITGILNTNAATLHHCFCKIASLRTEKEGRKKFLTKLKAVALVIPS